MKDETEVTRRMLVNQINRDAAEIVTSEIDVHKARLVAEHGVGNVWTTEELGQTFEVTGFMAPFCVVKRKSDGKVGSVMFQHSPRLYFNFQED